jgi:hypothetical protein
MAMQSDHDAKPNIVDALLMLICQGRIRIMEPFTLAYYINNGLVAAILCYSCTFSFIITLFFNDAFKYTL